MLKSNFGISKCCSTLLFTATLFGSVHHPSFGQTSSLQVPRFEEVLRSASDFPVTVPKAYESRRGYLIVKESPESHSKQTISLPVVIIKHKGEADSQGQAPIIKLAGGPGISGLNAAAYPGAYPWLSHRDFIILGQRGTQDAQPALVCPEFLTALNEKGDHNKLAIEAAKICRSRYEAQGINLSSYHSRASARDIESLRKVLNIEKLSLYGGSYGTRLALTYARDFPENVASMVLDSPLPHTVSFDDESPQNLKLTLQAVANACLTQSACAAAFPKLFQRFDSALIEAAETPWKVDLKESETRIVTDSELALLLNPSSPPSATLVPAAMDAIARRDIQALAPYLTSRSGGTRFAWGMRLSVWCSESAPFSQRYSGKPSYSFASLDGAVVDPEVCKVWNVRKRPMQEKAPTISAVPTLVIAGQFDHLTPPSWGQEVVSTLKNSHLAVIPYGGHTESNNWGGDGCAMQIADTFFKDEQDFLNNPSAATSCLNKRKPMNFVFD